MHGSSGQVILLRYQADLAEQFMHGVIGNVDARKPADPFRLLTEVDDRGTAAFARQQMGLELAAWFDVELGVDIAAEREQAAPHRAISR